MTVAWDGGGSLLWYRIEASRSGSTTRAVAVDEARGIVYLGGAFWGEWTVLGESYRAPGYEEDAFLLALRCTAAPSESP